MPQDKFTAAPPTPEELLTFFSDVEAALEEQVETAPPWPLDPHHGLTILHDLLDELHLTTSIIVSLPDPIARNACREAVTAYVAVVARFFCQSIPPVEALPETEQRDPTQASNRHHDEPEPFSNYPASLPPESENDPL